MFIHFDWECCNALKLTELFGRRGRTCRSRPTLQTVRCETVLYAYSYRGNAVTMWDTYVCIARLNMRTSRDVMCQVEVGAQEMLHYSIEWTKAVFDLCMCVCLSVCICVCVYVRRGLIRHVLRTSSKVLLKSVKNMALCPLKQGMVVKDLTWSNHRQNCAGLRPYGCYIKTHTFTFAQGGCFGWGGCMYSNGTTCYYPN